MREKRWRVEKAERYREPVPDEGSCRGESSYISGNKTEQIEEHAR